MRKTALRILSVLVSLLLPACTLSETVAVSFYPLYALTVNLTEGLEDVDVVILSSPDVGCLHDYHLTTGDMKALVRSDVFIICGAGMESYLAHVYDAVPDLPIIEASEGIELLAEEGDHDHHHEEDGHDDHEEVNAHVWLDAGNAMRMVDTICEGLTVQLPRYAGQLAANRDAYVLRLQALDDELHAGLAGLERREIVTFHEAFPYFAAAYGLNVAAVVTMEPGDALSPWTLATLIRTVRSLGNPPLFTEPQYDSRAAATVSAETGAPVYELDPIVSGPRTLPEALTTYEDAMRANLRVLQTALGPTDQNP